MAEQPSRVSGGSDILNSLFEASTTVRSKRKGSRKRPSSGGSSSSSPERGATSGAGAGAARGRPRRKRGRHSDAGRCTRSSTSISASASASASINTTAQPPAASLRGRSRTALRRESSTSVGASENHLSRVAEDGRSADRSSQPSPSHQPSSSHLPSSHRQSIRAESGASVKVSSSSRTSSHSHSTQEPVSGRSRSSHSASSTRSGGISHRLRRTTSSTASGSAGGSSSSTSHSGGSNAAPPPTNSRAVRKTGASNAKGTDNKHWYQGWSGSSATGSGTASGSHSVRRPPRSSLTGEVGGGGGGGGGGGCPSTSQGTDSVATSASDGNPPAPHQAAQAKSYGRVGRKRDLAQEAAATGSTRGGPSVEYSLRSAASSSTSTASLTGAAPSKRQKNAGKNLGLTHTSGSKRKEESSGGGSARAPPPEQGDGASVLRRSARSHANTGSCASTSSSRRTSRSGKLPLPSSVTVSTAEGMSSSQGQDASSGSQNGGATLGGHEEAAKATAGAGGGGAGAGPGGGGGAGGGPSGLSSGLVTADSESDDSDVGRLQALLEARGVPPHLLGALGPRMQHLLHRSMGASSASKAQQLLSGLQAIGDEGQQLQSVIEMCQMLVMGNEDTLAGFPVKQVVPALIALLTMDHNFDMMNHACRALTYMMEALPRSSAAVVDAVPVFLEKLQVIQCMDVAEQSLTALEMLSRRHSKAILQARGVSACLMYLDFFSITAQRAALSVTANCCQNLHADEFHFVAQSLPLLASRLTLQDKRSVECVCLAFSRLVDSFQNVPERLQEVASPELLTNLQQLLVVSPPVISTGTFITVLRLLSIMCSTCPDLALTLLRQNIAETLLYLLTGSVDVSSDEIELASRSPQELYEITSLIGELMPRLPSDGIFSVDALLDRPSSNAPDKVQWQWRDDRGLWHPYSSIDSRIIEAAHLTGEDEVSLTMMGRTYTVDLHSMHQINEDTGTTRPVQRRVSPVPSTPVTPGTPATPATPATPESWPTAGPASPTGLGTIAVVDNQRDARVSCLREERGLAASFIRSLFSVLYEVYSSSAGPSVRVKCLRALLRMVYYASADLLKDVLKNQVVSSHIAGMMASQDLRIVVGALQMADILMQKLPHVFGTHFTREGVMHQIRQLADPNVPLGASPPKNPPASSVPAVRPCTMVLGSLDGFPSQPSHPTTLQQQLSEQSAALDAAAASLTSGQTTRVRSQPGPSGASASYSVPIVCSTSNAHPSASAAVAATGNPVIPFLEGGPKLMLGSSQSTQVQRFDLLGSEEGCSPHSSQLRLSDVLKRKRTTPKRAVGTSSRKTRQDDCGNLTSSMMHDLFNKATSLSGSGRSTPNSSSRSRFAGSSKTTSFLASLNPARWGRSVNTNLSDRAYKESSSLSKSSSNPNLTAGNREKARTWVREQSSRFLETHCKPESGMASAPGGDVLSRLTAAIHRLQSQPNECMSALSELRGIVLESDISPFEVNHSGLVRAFLQFLAGEGMAERHRAQNLRCFLHVYANLPLDGQWVGSIPELNPAPLSALVNKLNGCVSQLEQFPVKVHDLPAGSGGGRGGTSALKFFNTHQLKCNLQRHPDCTSLKQWKGGTVKIDPLALVQAIERYLVARGFSRIRDKDSGDSDEDNSEEDIDDTLAAVVISQGAPRHKLQFLLNEQVLPYNMTVYQAVRQYSPAAGNDQSETDTDTEAPLGNAGVWVQTHTIYYRPVPEDDASQSRPSNSNSSVSTRKGKGSSSKTNPRRRADELWSDGVLPHQQSALTPFLTTSLPESVTIQDASLPVLCLLRVLSALNRHWGSLYPFAQYRPILSYADFVNSKIAAKASRQLQDPLVIMTGNLPAWLQQIACSCPFLFPFETRQLLLYATCFDRDRALQRLLDASPELSGTDSQERVTPRLERRKRTVSRDDILKQAEQVLQDLATSRALVEVQYENEVGTGLGPTLEFYALVSRELQKADLELWSGEKVTTPSALVYVHAPNGLFPLPLSRPTKVSQVSKIRSKFRFLGKLMAKAVMDSRMLDLPLSVPFYRWLLAQEGSLTLHDLHGVNPDVARTLQQLQAVVRTKEALEGSADMTAHQVTEAIDRLELDGCPIADLGLDFTLPGHPTVELRRGGRDISVTAHNLDQYCKLVVHWFLIEGVSRQMESFREGFETVFPLSHLRMFYPEELEAVFCGSNQSGGSSNSSGWDVKMLTECCRLDHGYTSDSRAVRFLFEVLNSYRSDEQRQFVQFVTGSPRLPVGGFKSLSPPLTIVRRILEPNMNPDEFLPSVMTCVNYLKLPDYSSVEVMRARLRLAAQEGQHSFHLS